MADCDWKSLGGAVIMLLASILVLSFINASPAQNQMPPFCTGQNRSLQFDATGWVCATIAGVVGPQGPQGVPGPQGAPGATGPAWSLPPSPPSSECITAKWDGAQWVCIPTSYLNAQ